MQLYVLNSQAYSICVCVKHNGALHALPTSRCHSTQLICGLELNRDNMIVFLTVRMAAASSCSWCSCLCRWNTVFIFNSWVSVVFGTSTSMTDAAAPDEGDGADADATSLQIGGVADFLRHLAMRRFFIIRSLRSTSAATFISCNLPSNDACRRCQKSKLRIVQYFVSFFLLFSSTFNLYLASLPFPHLCCLP